MKTERTQYPLLGMAGFLLVAGNAMWAAFLVCGWSIGLSDSQTEGIMEELRLPVILAAMGLIMLLTALGMSLYKDWKYRRRIEVPLVFSRFVWSSRNPGDSGQETVPQRKLLGEYCVQSLPCQVLSGSSLPGRTYYYTQELDLQQAQSLPQQATAFVSRKDPGDYIVVAMR